MGYFDEFSIRELSQAIKTRKVTPVKLVEESLARIKELEDKVIAWKVVDEEGALAAAKELTKEIENGVVRSPLHGIPIGIKDIIDVKGLPTRLGYEGYQNIGPAEQDAEIVAVLRSLGAIIVGKNHTAQFAYYDPAPTRNPYNLAHTPGGSSSGSAAAVAAGMVPLAVGTQTNASICRPAAYNGVAGFKPTTHHFALDGCFLFSQTFDSIGFFARSFEDIAVLYECLEENNGMELSTDNQSPYKIGKVMDPVYQEMSAGVRDGWDEFCNRLGGLGYVIEELESPYPFQELIDQHQIVMAYESGRNHADIVLRDTQYIGAKFLEFVQKGKEISEESYRKALNGISLAKSEIQFLYNKYDVLLTPPTDTVAPKGLESTGNPKFTTPWTTLGVPISTLPIGIDSNGLPLAVNLSSQAGNEVGLIKCTLDLANTVQPLPLPRF
jgi:aspartyl-tRNA(Asn)/glutamyl-tRNA(Gln) amidotransferase subunit A